MEVAIQEVLPDATHKWCKVHVLGKENEFIGPICSKKSGFKDDFQKISDSMLTVREFESAWQHLLDKYNLHGNAFLSQIYDPRHKWAKPYFKGKFCAKQTSMQRNECANHMFKGYVPLDRSINMFVLHYNKLQSDLDSMESFEANRSRKSGSYVVDEKERGKAYLPRHIRSDQAFEVGLACLVQLKQELSELKQVKDVSVLSKQCDHSAAQGSDVQGMSAAATSAGLEMENSTEAPDPKCKIVQHTQAKGPQ
ncbi:hypothetical protein BAE44_0019964 [Dichanthelium oligosanthes]|uniref:Protein FAR1-RELATED SEQUENCE n=1 Tax=Dichanthelium oligosanthes TaxID=888268 RepID=A0A1E5V1X6_9POAL|nr:hypothetical protein BAE44_0019964 [Dichanthelium oligosanthes]